jgi:PAS domain S-box-containing protein
VTLSVSVIVPLHRRTAAFERCIDASLRQLREGDELIVVSDTDLGPLPAGARLLLTGSARDTSPAEKRDVALEEARGDVCAFLDDDAYPAERWIERAVERLADPSIVAVGGPGATPPASGWRERAGGAFYESPFGSGGLRFRFTPLEPARDVDDFPAYNLFIRRDELRAIGGWDSSFYGGEDTKVCLSLRRAGHRIVYDPQVLVYHHRRRVFGPHLRQVANVGRHRGHFVLIHPETSRRALYFAPALGLLGALAAVVVIAVTQSAGYWLTLLLAAAPLYLTYKVYRAGAETEARQGAILEAAHDAIITMDQRLNIREFNPAAETMFGHQRTNILGRGVELLLPERERPMIRSALEQYSFNGRGTLAGRQVELHGLRADGSEFPLELTVARVRGDTPRGITGFVRDITERRLLEEQLRQSQKLEAIGRLASGVAHDFNNILMSIMGSADLLLMEARPGDPVRAEAEEIKESVQRGAGLTRQLLAFSRRQASNPRLIELGDVIGGMDTMLRRLIGPEIDFELVRPAGEVTVIADPAQIQQVVLNLAINARDAMPGGGRLTVRIDEVELDEPAAMMHAEGKAGSYARLSVTDSGTGIDESARARLFEPFFTTKEQGKGTGLGLSIVYGIVKQSGGYISVVSESGRGAAFIIHLPVATAPQPTAV